MSRAAPDTRWNYVSFIAVARSVRVTPHEGARTALIDCEETSSVVSVGLRPYDHPCHRTGTCRIQTQQEQPYPALHDHPPGWAGLLSLAEPVLDTTGDFAKLMVAMLGVAAKLKRGRIMERTARGRAGAKAKGVIFGRKPILTPHQQREARKRIDAGET